MFLNQKIILQCWSIRFDLIRRATTIQSYSSLCLLFKRKNYENEKLKKIVDKAEN